MAYFFLLLVIVPLSVQSYDELPHLSRIDRLLEDRFGPRNQRESNYGPRSYSGEMHLNEMDSNIRGGWPRVKNRRENIDGNMQLRENRPIPQPKLATGNGNKISPIPHPIPVFIPIFMPHPYPMPVLHLPVNFSAAHTSHPPPDAVHKHEHVILIRDRDHHLEDHSH